LALSCLLSASSQDTSGSIVSSRNRRNGAVQEEPRLASKRQLKVVLLAASGGVSGSEQLHQIRKLIGRIDWKPKSLAKRSTTIRNMLLSRRKLKITSNRNEHNNRRAQRPLPIILPFSGRTERNNSNTTLQRHRGSHRNITKGKKEKETTTTAGNASLDKVGTIHTKKTRQGPSTPSTPLPTVQELDLLHEANRDNTVYRNKRRNRRGTCSECE
jgi:hypothetical protein